MEANFRLELKKILSSVPRQSIGLGPGPGHSHIGYGAVVYGLGSGVFSTCVKKVFLIQCLGVSYPHSRFF
jgi:hypothetical protein